MAKTNFKDGLTVIESDFLNSIFGGDSTASATDPERIGHIHDGGADDGHVAKINLETNVVGSLDGSYLKEDSIVYTKLKGYPSGSDAIPVSEGTGANTLYYINPFSIADGVTGLVQLSKGDGSITSSEYLYFDDNPNFGGMGLRVGGQGGNADISIMGGKIKVYNSSKYSALETSILQTRDYSYILPTSEPPAPGASLIVVDMTNDGSLTTIVTDWSGAPGNSFTPVLGFGTGNLAPGQNALAVENSVHLTITQTNNLVNLGLGSSVILLNDDVSRLTNDLGFTANSGDITDVTAGVGLSGGGTTGAITLDLDLSELTVMGTGTAMVGTDEFIVLDAGLDRRKAASEIGLSIFDNDMGFITTSSGSVTAGPGIIVNGTNGTVSHEDTSNVASLVALTAASVVSDIDLDTYGHVTGLATRTITLADLGYTGATNATEVTNNNQLTNGSGFLTSTLAASTYVTTTDADTNYLAKTSAGTDYLTPTGSNLDLTNDAGYITSSALDPITVITLSNSDDTNSTTEAFGYLIPASTVSNKIFVVPTDSITEANIDLLVEDASSWTDGTVFSVICNGSKSLKVGNENGTSSSHLTSSGSAANYDETGTFVAAGVTATFVVTGASPSIKVYRIT